MGTNCTDPRELALLRENKGISLQGIAKATKLAVRYLEAIEQGDFTKLPGGIYNVSYIRQYAEALGYDASILLEQYYKATGDTPRSHPLENPATPVPTSFMEWLGAWTLLNGSMRKLLKI